MALIESRKVTVLDGAMGTELQRRGARVELPLWSALPLIENPNLIFSIHREYCEAGADILTTNTFRTHRRSLEKGGLGDKAESLTRLAVRLAKDAAEGKQLVAGSISPLEDCYRPDLSPGSALDEFLEIAEWLLDAGCDLLLIETMNNLTEARSAIRAAQKFEAEFFFSINPSNRDPQTLLSGEMVREALRVAEGEGASAFLVNCSPPEIIERSIESLAPYSQLPYGGYANNGTPDDRDGWRFDRELAPSQFADHVERILSFGSTIVGGCCGTTPAHIKELSKRLAPTRG
jgi:homocysteine S-methyltransferase